MNLKQLIFLFLLPMGVWGQSLTKTVGGLKFDISPEELDSTLFISFNEAKSFVMGKGYKFYKADKSNMPSSLYRKNIGNKVTTMGIVQNEDKSVYSITFEEDGKNYHSYMENLLKNGFYLQSGNTPDIEYSPLPGVKYLFTNSVQLLSCVVRVPKDYLSSKKFQMEVSRIVISDQK